MKLLPILCNFHTTLLSEIDPTITFYVQITDVKLFIELTPKAERKVRLTDGKSLRGTWLSSQGNQQHQVSVL